MFRWMEYVGCIGLLSRTMKDSITRHSINNYILICFQTHHDVYTILQEEAEETTKEEAEETTKEEEDAAAVVSKVGVAAAVVVSEEDVETTKEEEDVAVAAPISEITVVLFSNCKIQ